MGGPWQGYFMIWVRCDGADARRRGRAGRRVRFSGLALAFSVLAFGGCATQRVTSPPRTATEQYLLAQAVTEAVEPLRFDMLQNRRVFMDDQFFGAPEKAFVLGEMRARLFLAGAQVVAERKDAEIVLEVRSAGIGIDQYNSILGIPSIGAPSAATSAVSGVPTVGIVTPELAILKETRQISFASLAYVAYWADTGEVVASSGPTLGKAWRSDWWLFGFGPRTTGTVPPVDHHVE
jgi:hypothetical protein